LLCRSEKRLDLARGSCDAAFLALEEVHAPILSYQAQFLSGRIHEEMGQLERGAGAFQAALREPESLRGSLQGEELRISFMNNKLEVYQRLVRLALSHGSSGQRAEEAFLCAERKMPQPGGIALWPRQSCASKLFAREFSAAIQPARQLGSITASIPSNPGAGLVRIGSAAMWPATARTTARFAGCRHRHGEAVFSRLLRSLIPPARSSNIFKSVTSRPLFSPSAR
jgi:hypothetical protein